MGDFPLMTKEGTFIINGAERVVASQLVRSPGVYFTADEDAATGRKLFAAKLIPGRGAWLEFETSNKNLLTVKIDRKRKLPVTTLLRAIGSLAKEQWYGEQQPIRLEVGEPQDKGRTENGPFSGTVVELQSAQIRATGVEKLQCPACEAARKATIRGKLVIYPSHTPLRITRANKGPLWIRQGTTWTKR